MSVNHVPGYYFHFKPTRSLNGREKSPSMSSEIAEGMNLNVSRFFFFFFFLKTNRGWQAHGQGGDRRQGVPGETCGFAMHSGITQVVWFKAILQDRRRFAGLLKFGKFPFFFSPFFFLTLFLLADACHWGARAIRGVAHVIKEGQWSKELLVEARDNPATAKCAKEAVQEEGCQGSIFSSLFFFFLRPLTIQPINSTSSKTLNLRFKSCWRLMKRQRTSGQISSSYHFIEFYFIFYFFPFLLCWPLTPSRTHRIFWGWN